MDNAASRLLGTGAHALELDGVSRHFGALVALADVTIQIAAGERRAVLGSNGAGKTTLFNAITGDFMPTGGRIRFFGEDITTLAPHERIRGGLRRTYQISQLFSGLGVLDSIYLACRGVSRRRFSLVRPQPDDGDRVQAESILHVVHMEALRDTRVGELSHGQQRQLEIALALAGAPRFILFDEPAAGLSPTERRELIDILNALPRHIGYIIIEHDLDVALRVSEYVSMMHNGRLFREGTPEEIENDPAVQEIYLGGAQLSGGEQQMLAIARALLANPALLIMDEPTEGLAPVIVEQVEQMLSRLAAEGEQSILVIEQNIGVATAIADTVAIMVNGRIHRIMDSTELAADRDLQQRLLGVGRHADDATEDITGKASDETVRERLAEVYSVVRNGAADQEVATTSNLLTVSGVPNRWNLPVMARHESRRQGTTTESRINKVFEIPFTERIGRTTFVVGTFDTKGAELGFLRDCLVRRGVHVKTVDVSTTRKPSRCDVTPLQIASMHPLGASAVFSDDRGASVTAMGVAFARWIMQERSIGGVISAGGSGGTSMATAGMRALPIGIPKVMVSTVAAGDTRAYVDAIDVNMFHSVADIQGLNSITECVLANAAHALAGMIAGLPSTAERSAAQDNRRPAIGLTMFGVTTPCVQAVSRLLQDDYDCIVFHATGTGGRAMEALGHSALLAGFVDITTTEIADMIVGGVFAADDQRFGAAIDTGLPWVGSTGALDMVNFGPRETIPERFNGRRFVVHNPGVTLMRTTVDENRQIGEWIGQRINRMQGPVRFLLPEGGVSMLDRPGAAFHDPVADQTLFDAIEHTVQQTSRRQIIRVAAHINDDAFAGALVGAFTSITKPHRRTA